MLQKMRVKQSKSTSLASMIAGGIFLLIGVTIVIPTFGLFGVFWTLIALVITGSNAYNFFSNKGIASLEVDVESGASLTSSPINQDFEEKLRKLNSLKEDGLITKEEFNKKREEILNQKW